jgi:hypothetical protein
MIDRINRAIARWIRGRAGSRIDTVVSYTDDLKARAGLSDVWTMRWSDIARITAYMNQHHVGDTIVLVFDNGTERRVITEDLVGWNDLTRVLPDMLTGAVPFATWATWVTAHPQPESFEVFQRASAQHGSRK